MLCEEQLISDSADLAKNESDKDSASSSSLKRPRSGSPKAESKKPHLESDTTNNEVLSALAALQGDLTPFYRYPKEKTTLNGQAKQKGKRLIDNLINVIYNHQHSIFEVTKKCKNYLAVMGVPLKNGGHILFPEEVVYLLEHHQIYAVDGKNVLTLHDGYRVLGECGVSMHVYSTYSSLRQAGFVVLRPNRNYVRSLPLKELEQARPTEPSTNGKYPQRLLDCFPTLDHNRLIMTHLHRSLLFVPIPDLRGFNTDCQGFPKPSRFRRNFRQKIRPQYWPDLGGVREASSSWKQFSRLRKNLIESTSQLETTPDSASNPGLQCDFEVFLPNVFRHSQPLKPVFRVNCADSRYGPMCCSLMNHFCQDIPLVLSVFDCGHVCFIEVSGEPIDLNQYLRNLVEKLEKL